MGSILLTSPGKISRMDSSQYGWSIECFLEWLRVMDQEGHPFPSSIEDLERAMAHSSLLKRLLQGKRPLPEPPPCSMSHPWYTLIENGTAEPYEVKEAPFGTFPYPTLLIDQFPWR